jgi:hypothetical protein
LDFPPALPDGNRPVCGPAHQSGAGASSRGVPRREKPIKDWFIGLEKFAHKTVISKGAPASNGKALISPRLCPVQTWG